jgi:hypothetical protein
MLEGSTKCSRMLVNRKRFVQTSQDERLSRTILKDSVRI